MPPPSIPELGELIARASAEDGHPPFSDQALVDLRAGSRSLVTTDAAAAILGDGEVEFVVDPPLRGHGSGTEMLERVLATTTGPLLAWSHGDHPAARALAASHGFAPVRELLRLAAPVPAQGSSADQGFRAFRPSVDEDAWVALNAQAFAFHPEQGSVTRDDLVALEREDWFDAGDFLLAWDGDALIGYCWLKVEGGTGEFYVVGVAPSRQGSGLGRALMTAGFARLAERGIRQASLYVEGDNEPALALYRSLGFVTDARDIQYRLDR